MGRFHDALRAGTRRARCQPRPHQRLTIALSYIAGGLLPLAPYMLVSDITAALWWSIAVTLLALFVFGTIKGIFTGLSPFRGGVQTAIIGGLAAAAAFAIAWAVG